MLETNQSALLLDALKPPAGMDLDVAIGTTFTLDLAALLSIPVAHVFNEDGETEESADLLEQIRRYADRTVLFCQAGAITIPQAYRAAMTFVEQTVVEVIKPDHGLFHPKCWVMRFSGARGTHHRVLVMSRNLTFDHARDVLVRLDEDDQASATMTAEPLCSFLSWLPSQSARTLKSTQQAMLTSLADSLAGAALAVPEPFTEGEIVPLRPGHTGQPFHRSGDHALAISPFLTGRAAEGFLGTATDWSGVVSRRGALDACADALRDVEDVLTVRDAVLDAEQDLSPDDPAVEAPTAAQTGPSASEAALRGLHAKLYVQDTGPVSTTWLGSANLTGAAFTTNVELLVRLSGPTSKAGYDAILPNRKDTRGTLWDVLECHDLPDDETEPEDEDGVTELEHQLCDVASRRVTLALAGPDDERTADLHVDTAGLSHDVRITAALFTLPGEKRELVEGRATWGSLPPRHITPFVLLEVRSDLGSRTILVRADLTGDAESRRGAVMAWAIQDREAFMRYLSALLLMRGAMALGSNDGPGGVGAWTSRPDSADRVLEDLLTVAARHPERLESLEQTVRALEAQTDHPDEIVPAEFRELWDAVYAVRKDAL